MSEKLTPKQQAFCYAYLESKSASEAYRISYNTENMQPQTVNRKAAELMRNGKITARIMELQTEDQARHELDRDRITEEFLNISKEAREAGKFAPAVSALSNIAKMHGLLSEKMIIEQSQERRVQDLTDAELKRELWLWEVQATDEALELKIEVFSKILELRKAGTLPDWMQCSLKPEQALGILVDAMGDVFLGPE